MFYLLSSNTSIEEEHQVFFRYVVNFPDNCTNAIVRDSHYSPFLLPETPGFSELLWAPTPGPPLRLCSGDLTAPQTPSCKGNDLCMSARHHYKPNKLLVAGGLRGGVTWNFHKQRGGTNNFSAASRGDKKFNRVFHPVSTTPLPPTPWAKNW